MARKARDVCLVLVQINALDSSARLDRRTLSKCVLLKYFKICNFESDKFLIYFNKNLHNIFVKCLKNFFQVFKNFKIFFTTKIKQLNHYVCLCNFKVGHALSGGEYTFNLDGLEINNINYHK